MIKEKKLQPVEKWRDGKYVENCCLVRDHAEASGVNLPSLAELSWGGSSLSLPTFSSCIRFNPWLTL